jgi:late competence protein required for DNA uptake (superfamily II DNA/RNA helicase)
MTLVILYGHLIGFYTAHTLFIVFIFVIIITASMYAHDVIRDLLHRRVKGLQIVITNHEKDLILPKTITINEIRKKNHQLVYRYQGFNIPISFIERVDQERAYLYPFFTYEGSTDDLFEILENYRYKYFLVKDRHHHKYIITCSQVLSIV